jgi:phthiocerol/phenolphthiocerol synthesis type-I polyketide synthase B
LTRPIAIVGIGCRFPGGVTDPEGFWRLLRDGGNAITEIPRDRIDLERWFDARPATPGRMMTRWGGFLDHLQDFDAGFFGISPREAERMDPQQRLLLETAWEALEDAGQDVSRLDGTRTGVFVGQWLSDFEARLFADPEGVDFLMTTGSGRYASAGRLSFALGLRGPSLTIDTACSSSLVAVHLAARSIGSGECEVALAGGTNVILQPHITLAYSQSRMMAPDGRCKFGDASGDGYVRSEGAAVVVLKDLDRAVADGDRIYAVVRGSAVNNDGRSSGSLGTPSRIGQEELLRAAYRDAGIAPRLVGYVEAHGTGTRTGDPVELGALGAVLAEWRPAGSRARVGSVKTQIGHTEGAAGVAGVIKTALALHHGTIPPSLHFREPNPAVDWAGAPFEIPVAATPWPRGDGTRVAGVSAFGIAGTNAHVVLEEAPARAAAREALRPARDLALLPLSARSPEALRALALRHAEALAEEAGPALQDLCLAAATRRTQLEHRAAFVAGDRAGMADALRRFAAGEPATAEGVVAAGSRPRVAFVFPGQGAQFDGMARELLAREPVFRAALEACDRAARQWVDWSILEQLAADPGAPGHRLGEIDVIQPVLVAIAIAYAELWKSFGVAPDAVVGHSMGEIGAAHVAGILDLDQAMRIVCRRSALMRRIAGRGAMALVELSMDEAQARIGARADRLSVAVNNGPRSSVISGDPGSVAEVLSELERDGIFCRLVKVDVASHSPQMDPLAAELAAELAGLAPAAARIPLTSTVLGRAAEGAELGATYWAWNLRQPVRFGSAVEQMLAGGATVFVELGPHPVLLPAVQQMAQATGCPVSTIACGRREEPGQAGVMAALGSLWAAGVPIDWRALTPQAARDVRLPLYPWQRERHWVEAAELGRAVTGEQVRASSPDEESLGWLHRLRWEPSEPPEAPPAAGSWLVLSSDADAGAAIASALGSARWAPLTRLESTLAERRAAGDASPERIVVLAEEGPDAPFLPVRTLQALLGSGAGSRLWFVTRGSQAVTGEATRVSVDQAALWGAARVVAEEHPECWGGLVDLDPAAPAAAGAGLLARHLRSGDGEDQVALRGRGRHVLRLERAEAGGRPAGFAWRKDAAYLVTGGLGDAGLHVARTLAAQGVRRLVLLGRTPLPPRETWSGVSPASTAGQRIAAVRALEASGVAVHLGAVDVADEAQLKAFLDRYRAEGWPPIRGVVHAAGALSNQLAAGMTRASFDAIVGPKLGGARHLDRLLPELDLFVLFSSTGAFLAQAGQANYAAANAGLDALALDRRSRGLPALSIGWGVWEGTGLVKGEAGEQNLREMARQGVRGFSPERATALFSRLVAGSEPALAVLPIDWAAYRGARRGRVEPLFRDLTAGANGSALEGGPGEKLAHASPARRRQLVEGVVRDSLSRVLKIAPARIDARAALGSMGLNSLLAMELRNRLEAALGRSLPATLAFNYPTLTALVDHLAGGPGAAATPRPAPPPEAAPPPAAALEDIAQLTDDEAAMALRSRPTRGTP